jgi:hypothetical protein
VDPIWPTDWYKMHILMHFNSINTAILVGHFEYLVIHHLTILETIALNLVTHKN